MFTLKNKNFYLSDSYRFYTLIAIYLICHFFIRIFFEGSLQVDDAEQIRLGQDLQLGYLMRFPQPPLYSWLAWGIFQIFGVSIFSISLLKYLLIMITFIFIFKIADALYKDTDTQYFAGFSFLLMPSFAWHMHQGFTHTILLGCALMMSLFWILKILKEDNTKNYIYLGLSLGIGILSKYSFFIFMFIAFLSIFTTQKLRKKFINKKFIYTIFLTFIISTPHFLWIFNNQTEIFELINNRINLIPNGKSDSNNLSFLNFYLSSIAFVSPLVFLMPSLLKNLFFSLKEAQSSHLFLNNFYYLILLFPIVIYIFIPIPEIKVRWLHPAMMLFPFLMFLKIFKNKEQVSKYSKIFYITLVLLTLIILFLRIYQFEYAPNFGKLSRINTPILKTLDRIDLKFKIDESYTIKTSDSFLASHLLIKYPKNHIILNDEINNRIYNFRNNNVVRCLHFEDNDHNYKDMDESDFEKILLILKTIVGDKTYLLSIGECKS